MTDQNVATIDIRTGALRVLYTWLSATAVLVICAAVLGPPPIVGSEILPYDSDSSTAARVLAEAFPFIGAGNMAAVVVSRPDQPLTKSDQEFIASTVADLAALGADRDWDVVSPSTLPKKLRSGDRRAAMIVVRIPSDFASNEAFEAVQRIEEDLENLTPPEGLSVELTGLAALAHDMLAGAQKSLHRTTWITVIALIGILLWVYRAPLAALVVLVPTGISVVVVMQMLTMLAHVGVPVSHLSRTLAVVLMFGSGTDFGLFLIERYRERLRRSDECGNAMREAVRDVGTPITRSAATTMIGLAALSLADIVPVRTAGLPLAAGIGVTWLSAVTLIPAAALLAGRWLFWPTGPIRKRSRNWSRIGSLVSRRPGTVLGGLAVLAAAAVVTYQNTPLRYDTLIEAPTGSSAARGKKTVECHFSAGSLWSDSILLRHQSLMEEKNAIRVSQAIRRRLTESQVDAVVETMTEKSSIRFLANLRSGFVDPMLYHNHGLGVVRVDASTTAPPLSAAAAENYEKLRSAAHQAANDIGILDGEAFVSGPSAYARDVVLVSARDFRLITLVVASIIALLLGLMTRKAILSVFLVLATIMTYVAAVALTGLILGSVGDRIDWKVQLFSFVILVAVGQDYNLFLVSRLLAERQSHRPGRAVLRAVARTGVVISNCGLIMAVTLGSLSVSELSLMRQTGLALSLGILIDTFVIRPLAVPSFQLISWRLGHSGKSDRSSASLSAE
jgi:RND superfamily putative drug exporter